MIDSHCHLTDPRLNSQLKAVLARATAGGVARMVTIGTSPEESAACVELCRSLPNVRCTVGLHPNYVNDETIASLPQLRGLLAGPSVVAMGEMGLDYHYDTASPEQQRLAFEQQLQIALEFNRPVVIHCREAVDDCLAVMRNFRVPRAVFHCFTGTADEAKKILDDGYLLGFTGPITFKKNDALREVVRLTPADRLLVETDAPYLAPEPMRKQKINEPALVMHVAAMVAHVKGWSIEETDATTTLNTQRFFDWVP